jgi:hypothetical protein
VTTTSGRPITAGGCGAPWQLSFSSSGAQVAGKSSAANLKKPDDLHGSGASSARSTRFAADSESPAADEDAADAAAHKKRADELQEQRRALESSMRGLQTAGLTDRPAMEALQAALVRVAALQQTHRSEKELGLPTKILRDRVCRDRDQAVQKLSRTQGEREETQTQLAALLKRQGSSKLGPKNSPPKWR